MDSKQHTNEWRERRIERVESGSTHRKRNEKEVADFYVQPLAECEIHVIYTKKSVFITFSAKAMLVLCASICVKVSVKPPPNQSNECEKESNTNIRTDVMA